MRQSLENIEKPELVEPEIVKKQKLEIEEDAYQNFGVE